MATDELSVEVVYALPDTQVLVAVKLPAGATLQEAIIASGILAQYPEIDLNVNAVGVFGQQRALDTVVSAGDRVEIYRPLKADPKEVRRQLAKEGKTMGRNQ